MKRALCLMAMLLVLPVTSVRADDAPNEAAGFVGATTKLDEDATSFTLGADYARKVSTRLGIGALVDVDFADEKEILLAPKAEFDPGANFSLTFAAGVHFIEDSDNSFVIRFGVGYDFETSKVTLTPILFVDLEDGDDVDLVYGLSFGFPF